MEFCLLSLNPGYDRWAVIERESSLPRVIRAVRGYSLPAGKGIDVARCLHRLNEERYVCFTFLGGIAGELIRRGCEEEGLRMRCIPIRGESRVNHTSVYLTRGETFTVNEAGPEVFPEEADELDEAVLAYLRTRPGCVLTVCGTACPGYSPQRLARLCREAKSMGNLVAADIGGAFLPAVAEAGLDLLKINREEFALAFSFDGWEASDRLRAFLEEYHIPTLVLTDGGRGCVGHTRESTLKALLPPGCGGPYTVGSGDSFLGGYLAAWAKGDALADRLILANACGVSNTLSICCGAIDCGQLPRCLALSRLESS